jgi:hypothetical protein
MTTNVAEVVASAACRLLVNAEEGTPRWPYQWSRRRDGHPALAGAVDENGSTFRDRRHVSGSASDAVSAGQGRPDRLDRVHHG